MNTILKPSIISSNSTKLPAFKRSRSLVNSNLFQNSKTIDIGGKDIKKTVEGHDENNMLGPIPLSEDRIKELTRCAELEFLEKLEMCVDSSKLNISNLAELVPNLKCLKLSNGILPSIGDLGQSLNKLEILWMSRCCLKSLDGLDGFRNIRELYLSFNDVSDISKIGSLTKIEILDLEGNKIKEAECLGSLQNCKALVNLTLEGNPLVKKFGSYSNYWFFVKQSLPNLKILDNVSTSSEKAHRTSQNQYDFDDEWIFINEVIKEVSNTMHSETLSRDEKESKNRLQQGKATKSSSSLEIPTSSIHLSPSEKRMRVKVDNDGIVCNPNENSLDSSDRQKWTESLPKIASLGTSLTTGKAICGDIGKALRYRRSSTSEVPSMVESSSQKLFKVAKQELEMLKIEVDNDLEEAVITKLQNACTSILDELNQWKAEFARKPALGVVDKSRNDRKHLTTINPRLRPKLPSGSTPSATPSPSVSASEKQPSASTQCSRTLSSGYHKAFQELEKFKAKLKSIPKGADRRILQEPTKSLNDKISVNDSETNMQKTNT